MIKRSAHPPEVREMALEKLKEGYASPSVCAYLREKGFSVDPSTILNWKRKAGIQVKRRIKPARKSKEIPVAADTQICKQYRELVQLMRPLR